MTSTARRWRRPCSPGGAVLRGDKHPEEAIAAWNRLVGRMGDAAQPAVRAVVAMALIDKGNTLSADLARHAEAITAYRQVVDLFGIDPQPAIRYRWADALCLQAVTLGELGDAGAAAPLTAALDDGSDQLLGAARWALDQLVHAESRP